MLFIMHYRVVLTFESMGEILKCNEMRAILKHFPVTSAVCYAGVSIKIEVGSSSE